MNTRLQTGKSSSTKSGFMPRSGAVLQRQCACGGSSGLTGSCAECGKKKLIGQPLQTQLRVNEPGDEYEQEAERVAEQVMRMAESDVSPGRQPGVALQRLDTDGRLARTNALAIQRQQAAGLTPVAEDVQQTTDVEAKDEDSRCPSWRNDPQSISKSAAENYAQNDMAPPSKATVEHIDCETPRDNGNYGCYVHFSDGLVIRVIVRAMDIVVGTGPGPFTTLTPPPGTPLCFYDYHCPDGLLVLTKRECKSAKPVASSGPTLVAQRRVVPGPTGPVDAAPMVSAALSSPGQPLDMATQGFFSARFGHDFAGVRVHADAGAAQSARAVSALAYTVGRDIVFGAGQYAPGTRAGQRLLAHELTHVVQQGGSSPRVTQAAAERHAAGVTMALPRLDQANDVNTGLIQRQPNSEAPTLRDVPIFLEKLELDIGKNLQDNGHHLYQTAILHRDEPELLQNDLSRYALGLNVLKTSYRFAGFKPDTADKLAVGTGILFKGLTFLREGEFTLDFQVDIGRGVKFEANLQLGVNPKAVTEVRKADVNFGLVRRF